MAKLPRAPAIKRIAAFKRAGWVIDHEEYIDLFYKRKRRKN